MAQEIRRIGVIGAGTMGNGIAQAFAVAGYPVVLREIAQGALDHGVATVKNSLARLVAKEKMTAADAEAALQRIAPTIAVEDLGDCDLVVEAVLEKFEVKKAVIADLERVCGPETIFASNN